MGSFLFWLLVCICVIALVLLLFPFLLRIDFEVAEKGAWAKFYLFKKNLYSWEKEFKKKSSHEDDFGDFADDLKAEEASLMVASKETAGKDSAEGAGKDGAGDSAVTATYVPYTPPKAEKENKPIPAVESAPKSAPVIPKVDEKVEVAKHPAPAVEKMETPSAELATKEEKEQEKKEKRRKLTDEETWTILLTPEFDGRLFRYLKKLVWHLLLIFRIQFRNCFVEGIRSDYKTMGYMAALNGFLKSFPYVGAWDLRMDWTGTCELRAAGSIHGSLNLSRVLAFVLELLFCAAVLGLSYWRRRRKVLKTGELPELGFVRKKIVDWMTEE